MITRSVLLSRPMSKNFRRFLAAAFCYMLVFARVVMPISPIEYCSRLGLAAVITVLMGAAFASGTIAEKLLCAMFGAPAFLYLVFGVLKLLTGELHFADA